MKKKIFSYAVVSILLIMGIYLYIGHDKMHETKVTSMPPCHINK
ncbi:hypothetical protein BACCIP111899_03338 [Bacillus rhizoplanae]|uniref:Uncharacterized protein n=1 Tax=Bacillus rhizoplanae TaxID=2880966 RepID=A0ABM8YE82_9BACI|nr:hypothetical protein BACCIP111899_03338 [Bacillus rhizoplanae]